MSARALKTRADGQGNGRSKTAVVGDRRKGHLHALVGLDALQVEALAGEGGEHGGVIQRNGLAVTEDFDADKRHMKRTWIVDA
ncbi:hypothetical protein D3C71_1368340 [compost metagenome]